jgi:hypothetical protein
MNYQLSQGKQQFQQVKVVSSIEAVPVETDRIHGNK